MQNAFGPRHRTKGIAAEVHVPPCRQFLANNGPLRVLHTKVLRCKGPVCFKFQHMCHGTSVMVMIPLPRPVMAELEAIHIQKAKHISFVKV